jgi:imidazolonepropionase-like amidohydrolase
MHIASPLPIAAACAAALFLALTARVPLAAAELMITDVTVINPRGGAAPHQDVLIGNNVIAAVGETGSIATFAPVDTLDGKGKFLIPALWDAHVHLTFNPELGDAALPLFVANGVTRVRDTGGKLDLMLAVRDRAVEQGSAAPAIYFAGPLLDGHPRVYDGTPARFPDISVGIGTEAEAIAEVDRLAAAGVHLIKTYEMVTPEVFRALVQRASDHGLPVTSHVPLSMDVASVAEAGVRGMEHLRNIGLSCSKNADDLLAERTELLDAGSDKEGSSLRASIHASQRPIAFGSQDEAICQTVVQSLADAKVFQTPTLALNTRGALRPFLDDGWSAEAAHLPQAVRENWHAYVEIAKTTPVNPAHVAFADWALLMTSNLHASGVPLMAGTDTPIGLLTPGFSLHLEMEMLVRAGLTPLEAIAAATVRPAEFFGMEDEMGTIAPGKSADLVLLDANPLENIQHTRSINTVIMRGDVLDRQELDTLLETAAP